MHTRAAWSVISALYAALWLRPPQENDDNIALDVGEKV